MKFAKTLRRIFRPRDPRRKVLLWATMVALFCGITDIGQPVDMAMQIVRNEIRKQPVSGDIVIVGIDDKTIERLGTFPFSNAPQAKVLNTLSAMGAKSVHYDIYMRKTTDAAADNAMADALRNARMPVTLPVGISTDPQTGKFEEMTSAPMFRKLAGEVSIAFKRNFLGFTTQLGLGNNYGGEWRQSMAARLAGDTSNSNGNFLLDYSYDTASIKPISFVDLLAGSVPSKQVLGKTIIVAPIATSIRDMHRYLGQYEVPGGYIHLIGAEHLKKGMPVDLGWLLMTTLAFAFGAFALKPRYDKKRLIVGAVGFPTLFITCILLEMISVSSALFPAFMLISYALIGRIWINFARARANVNADTGLANLNGLRDDHMSTDGLLVVMHARNFDRIATLLGAEGERQLIAQIVHRLGAGASGATIYQTGLGSFAWLVPARAEADMGEQLDGLHGVFHTPIALSDRRIDLDVCFGLDVHRGHSIANRYASARMAAEDAGKNGQRWKQADVADVDDLGWRLSALGELDAAIDNGQLWVAYQPQLDLTSGQLAGAEALVRWSHPTRGDIRPDEFIQLAEDHNRIGKLTLFVLRESIATAAVLNDHAARRAAEQGPFRIAVNISARMLDDRSVVDTINAELARENLPPSALVLELTESGLLRDNAVAVAVMTELRDLGIGISLDDYGTGYSTLGYLRDMPANEIKIDRKFVKSVSKGGSDGLLVGSTIELAHSMGKTVVAEGVEDAETLDTLRLLQCDVAQGFYIAQPMRRDLLLNRLAYPSDADSSATRTSLRSAA